MAWQYADWELQSTYSAQRSRLLQHRTELRQALVEKTTSDGETLDPTTIQAALEMTERDLQRLDRLVDAEGGSGMPRFIPTYSPRRAY